MEPGEERRREEQKKPLARGGGEEERNVADVITRASVRSSDGIFSEKEKNKRGERKERSGWRKGERDNERERERRNVSEI